MKIKIGNDFFLKSILAYPILLGLIFFIKYDAFVITAPYFFIVFIVCTLHILSKKRLIFKRSNSINVVLTLLIILVSILNFTTIRYSLLILFSVYIFSLHLFLIVVFPKSFYINKKIVNSFFITYIIFSFLFLFVDHGYMEVGNRFIGFTGSPTTFSGILVAIFIFLDSTLNPFGKKRLFYLILVLLFVYLSKTRLVLLFFIAYPFLLFIIERKTFRYGSVFLIGFSVLFFIYGLYGVVIEKFPELITIRYEDARDASFGLRYRLYKIVEVDFLNGNVWQMLFGKGNEYSRLLIIEEIGIDMFPHNDFIRIINDWGILGAITFFILLYRLAIKNITALFIALLYLILWYSNMVFNLFMISILILAAFQAGIKLPTKNKK